MTEEEIYSVTQWLPKNEEMVLCFGHLTYCCIEDMEKDPAWHEVIFRLKVTSYKLKTEIPLDPEASILERYTVAESWDIDDEGEQVIGVTKWKKVAR